MNKHPSENWGFIIKFYFLLLFDTHCYLYTFFLHIHFGTWTNIHALNIHIHQKIGGLSSNFISCYCLIHIAIFIKIFLYVVFSACFQRSKFQQTCKVKLFQHRFYYLLVLVIEFILKGLNCLPDRKFKFFFWGLKSTCERVNAKHFFFSHTSDNMSPHSSHIWTLAPWHAIPQ